MKEHCVQELSVVGFLGWEVQVISVLLEVLVVIMVLFMIQVEELEYVVLLKLERLVI
jgi:hypothetical protein